MTMTLSLRETATGWTGIREFGSNFTSRRVKVVSLMSGSYDTYISHAECDEIEIAKDAREKS